MPEAWRLALKGLWAAVKAFIATYVRRLADANAGAQKQRDDQDAADATARDEAKTRHDEWASLSAAERRAHLDRLDQP